MKNELQKYINESSELDNRERWEIRETIINLLKRGYEFSELEIEFILNNFWLDSISHYLTLNKDFIKKWVDRGYDIKRFPKTIYKDDEITEYVLNHSNYVNDKLVENITPEILKRYAQTHSDYDLYRIHTLCMNKSKHKDEISKLKNNSRYSIRLKNGEESYRKNSYGLVISEKWIKQNQEFTDMIEGSYTTQIPEARKVLSFNGDVEQINFVNEVLVNQKELLVKRKVDFSLWSEKNNEYVFHYISDLHLTHKIKMLVDEGIESEVAITKIVKQAVNDIIKSVNKVHASYLPFSPSSKDILLIAGDISYDYEINRFFYSLLKEELDYGLIYVVLGNHELWDSDPTGIKDANVEAVVKKYRKMLGDIDIKLLNNDVVIFSGQYRLEYSFNELLSKKQEINDIFKKSNLCIFGSIGFSGLNEKFNAQNGIYRGSIRDINIEKMLSKQTSAAFDNLLELRNNTPVVCLTHMPYNDWYSGQGDLNDCYFVSGHTHSNYYKSGNPAIYSDNQVGYNGKKYSTKQFFFDIRRDIFDNLNDGVHEIHCVDYLEYLRYKGLNVPYASAFENLKIFLIRKNNISMFVTKTDKGKLAILNGAKRKNLNISDINYYYDNMDKVGEIILNASKNYHDYVEAISKEVKKIGGDGKIHGCIVDLDFNNKIYINPFDGKITAYCAPYLYSTERIIYGSVYKLLQENPTNSEDIAKMRINIDKNIKGSALVTGNNTDKTHSKSNDYEFSNAYRMSYTVKKIEAFIDDGILKIWPDEIDLCNKQIVRKSCDTYEQT